MQFGDAMNIGNYQFRKGGIQPSDFKYVIDVWYMITLESRVKVNALLDDASTKTYINADVAAELLLQGQFKQNEL